jgi:HD-like signal output (HDOD) protein
MKRILFVDDEPALLDGLRRMLFPFRREWYTAFAADGACALELLTREPFDVIVADMRMPEMSGTELLTEVTRRYPHMVRMILSGTWDQDLRMQAAVTAHRYLPKPCDSITLTSSISRACPRWAVPANQELKNLITRMNSLPSAPAALSKLVDVLRSPDASVREAADLVANDMALSAKVLQLVNSAFFGARRQIANPREAVAYVGVDSLRTLALSVGAFSSFEGDETGLFSISALHAHAAGVARAAGAIVKAEQAPKRVQEETVTAGLLHDVGKLVLASNFKHDYDNVLAAAETTPLCDAERDVFGATHAEVGAYLLWLWGLPDAVVEAAAFHHDQRDCRGADFTPLAAVQAVHAVEQPGGQADAAFACRESLEQAF